MEQMGNKIKHIYHWSGIGPPHTGRIDRAERRHSRATDHRNGGGRNWYARRVCSLVLDCKQRQSFLQIIIKFEESQV